MRGGGWSGAVARSTCIVSVIEVWIRIAALLCMHSYVAELS